MYIYVSINYWPAFLFGGEGVRGEKGAYKVLVLFNGRQPTVPYLSISFKQYNDMANNNQYVVA
jgi:hypothetical protein